MHQQIYKLVRSAAKKSLSRIGGFLVRQSPLPAQPVMDSSHFPWATMLALLTAVIRRTPFVTEAARNLKQWEDQFRRQLAAAGGQVF